MEKNSLNIFIELITFDQSFYQTKKEIKRLQSEVQSAVEIVQGLVDSLDTSKEYVRQFRKDVDIRELEMKDLDEQEKKASNRLNATSNEKEYNAVKEEISRLKKKQHDYEETLIEVWNSFENAKKEQIAKEKEVTEQKEEVERNLQLKQVRVAELQEKIDGSAQERNKKEKDVPEEWLERYGRMRNLVSNPAVQVVGGSCSACFYKISDQDCVFISKQQLIQCKDCYRFLYNNEEEQPEELLSE